MLCECHVGCVFIMVIALGGVQFGVKSDAWLQNEFRPYTDFQFFLLKWIAINSNIFYFSSSNLKKRGVAACMSNVFKYHYHTRQPLNHYENKYSAITHTGNYMHDINHARKTLHCNKSRSKRTKFAKFSVRLWLLHNVYHAILPMTKTDTNTFSNLKAIIPENG